MSLIAGNGGLSKLQLTSADGARAEVYLHGAHVTSWIPAGTDDERLFLSSRSEYRDGAAIRGGIPVIFPQFAGRGPLPKHGFARNTSWTLDALDRDASGFAIAVLRLESSATTRAIWPHPFAATLMVRVGGDELEVTFAVANTGDEPFDFTAALHTYLRVADIQRARLRGLRNVRYEDSTTVGAERVETDDDIRIDGEIDRVYLNVSSDVEVTESGGRTRVTASGFPDVVVWNPGPKRAVALTDLSPDDWRRMLCVESAAVRPMTLAPEERWSGTQRLTRRD